MTKTRQQKQASGTLKKHRDKVKLNFQPLTAIPAPLDELNEIGMNFYKSVCEILLSNQMLTSADIFPVTEAATYWEIRCEAMRQIRKQGFIYKTEAGYTQKNAFLQTLNDANRALDGFYKAYGLNYASRSKMDFPKKEDDEPSILDI